MANSENLQPFTKENAKYYGKKGGIKSGQVRAKRKSLKEQMKILLEMPITNENRINKLKQAGFEESEINNQLYLTYSTFEKAISGDIRAVSLVCKIMQNEDKEKNSSFNDTINEIFIV